MSFEPRQNKGALVLLVVTVALLLATVVITRVALHVDVGPGALLLLLFAFVLWPIVALLAIYTAGFWLMSYNLSRDGLLVSIQPLRFYIPMEAIEGIYTAPENQGRGRFRGLLFMGHNVGFERTDAGKTVIYLATANPEECLYIQTATRIYALSPDNKTEFLRQYEAERNMGAVHSWQESLELLPAFRSIAWRDSAGVILAVGAYILALLLLSLAFWYYPKLPAEIPMHFDALGRPDRLASPEEIFYLPLIGSITIFANFILAILLYKRERLLSYFLWGGAALVQVLLFIAMRSIVL